jgi:DNA polymerase III epsilon subunit-like protein
MTDSVFVAVDTETTGFDSVKTATVTQVAAIAIDVATGAFISQGVVRIKLPPEHIETFNKEAMEVQKWTPEINETGQPLDVCREQFHAWFRGLPRVEGYVAHCARFDKNFMRRLNFAFPAHPWYCTREGMKHAEKTNRTPLFTDHKLKTLAKACGYVQVNEHSALDDVMACANGFQWLRSLGVPVEEMMIAAAFAQ